MNKPKRYKKILSVSGYCLLIFLFWPIILAFFLCVVVYAVFKIPKDKKEYEKSRYYLDFKKKFRTRLFYSPEYRFYNFAVRRNLPIQYIRQESNGFEYFIFNGTLYLFPDFEQIDYDAEKGKWQVYHDGEWDDFEETYDNLLAKPDNKPDIPVKLLVEHSMFTLTNLNDVDIPDVIHITRGYDEAFENEDSAPKMVTAQSTKELYEMMLQTSDLCGHFELPSEDGNIIWHLYDDICIEIGVGKYEGYLGVSKTLLGKAKTGLTHWHPTAFEIYNEVCKIGKRGNVMIIRTFASGGEVLYIGNKETCPYQKNKRCLFGKLYYLEAK